MEAKSLQIPCPGRFTLRLPGLGPRRPNDSRHSLTFMRPNLPQAVGYILSILLAVMLSISSLVLFLLRLPTFPGT